MQVPHTVAIVTHPDPGVSRDHVVLNSEDRTPVIVDPGNLRQSARHSFLPNGIFHLVSAEPDHGAGEDHIPALGHSHVLHSAYEVRPQPPRVHLVACTSHNLIVCLKNPIVNFLLL